MACYVGLDIGTSGVRAVAFAESGAQIAEGAAPLQSYYSNDGGAKQNPAQWWHAAASALQQLSRLLGERKHTVRGIGLSAQCPTFTLLYEDGSTWETAYLYQDNRAVAEYEKLVACYGNETIFARTGENPSPFYILPKLLRLQQAHPEAFRKRAFIVQPRDYVAWKLSGVLVTDPTHAACTLAYDINQAAWIKEWTEDLQLHSAEWPQLKPSISIQGELTRSAAEITGFPSGIAIVTGAADSLSAVYGLFGLRTNVHDALFDISGTSTCLHAVLPKRIGISGVNVYPFVDGRNWCLEAGLNTTGAVLEWQVKLFGETHESVLDQAARVAPGAEGLIFLPHLSGGERDSPDRTGAWIGLQLGHGRKHLIRSALEGVALAVRHKADQLCGAGCAAAFMLGSGGGMRAEIWNQIKADVLQLPVMHVLTPDMTVGGAARMAAEAMGENLVFSDADIRQFEPNLSHKEVYESLYNTYRNLEAIPPSIRRKE